MEYPTKTDPVIVDEATYDRICEANQVRMERARDQAQEDFEYGELKLQLDEWLLDNCPIDLVDIALAVIEGIDTNDMELTISRVSIAIASIRSTIDAVIEDRAEELYQSGENY